MLKRLSAISANWIDAAPCELDVDTSSRLLLGMLQGAQHFRCLLGLQPGLTEAEKERLVEAAVSFFLKGHAYVG